MKRIATLTMNPTIDVAYEVGLVKHTHKMRTQAETYAPGGGGINVARVFVRLGGNARCFYLSGGATGPALDGLVDLHQLVRTRIPIAEPTRVAAAVLEHDSGKEYRFTPEGPTVSEAEWQACLDALDEAECGVMVLSGSLPRGVPADFYARAAAMMEKRGIDTVLDSSGEALRLGVEGGRLLLVKPSSGELEQMTGRTLNTTAEIGEEAMRIVTSGKAKYVAVTMGHEGAVLARKEGWVHAAAPEIEAQSAVGAGDSFLAAMIHAMLCGRDDLDAFRFGMAAGSAAVLSAGTGLAHPPDIERIFALMPPLVAA
ncbi:1-phosphofructokinase [Novosphingobium sp. PC22D]|uniref:1-phosphofructokinase family hexose kinase n=1 Tax=Novosphingobium sp. PC22D TaxID=1962403 RepID=UPI000BF01032|nr:1-phosphofructokinase family hexose kinase [Novosphingobium sp. PC22D]PEQ10404.1 1-phosphofructokinase [Novosphingobium sp. PC22D]